MKPLRSLSILLVGEAERAEFDDARKLLERWGCVAHFPDADRAAAALDDGGVVPDVIVAAQAFPGQFSHAAIDRLRRSAPLTPIIGLMGSWCEGELRSGDPWPGVVRTYWHQWAARCDRQLRRLADGAAGSWTLPPTAADEERLLADAGDEFSRQHGLVVISSQSAEMAAWLADACRRRGFATVRHRGPLAADIRGATAAIFDGTDAGDDETDELCRFAAMLRPAPVIALLAFPRIEHRQRALAAGAATVVSKPLLLDDLMWQLDAVTNGL